MNNMYDYTTTQQQIQKLKSQLLKIDDEDFAAQMLQRYGYYNIINGYRDPYMVQNYGVKKYCSDVTFDQIFDLFILDHKIRDAILLSMIDLEEHLRAVVADIIAEDFGSDYKTYLDKNNYRDRPVSNPRFRRNLILEGIRKTAESSNTQPIKYYREQHGIIPPWILLKGVNFGTLVNYIRFFKSPQRDKLVKQLYGDAVTDQNINTYKDLLSDTLFTCLEYRNLAAHGGRIYNYIPNTNIRYFKNSDTRKGLPQLLYILSRFNYIKPHLMLDSSLMEALNGYCNIYPNDLRRIESSTGFTLYKELQVWINPNSKKYHVNQHCGGAQCPVRLEINIAENMGYTACKRCCK